MESPTTPSRGGTISCTNFIDESEFVNKSPALRETQEETGYTSNQIQLICKTAPNPAINDNTAFFYLIENAVPTAHSNPDFYEDIEVVLYSKKDFIELLQQNKIMHGVQLGPIYEALIQLGWLQYSWWNNTFNFSY